MNMNIDQTPRYKWAWAIEGRWPETPWWILNLWQWLGCKLLGHVPIPDQCGIPDHDFCAWCQKSMPGMGQK